MPVVIGAQKHWIVESAYGADQASPISDRAIASVVGEANARLIAQAPGLLAALEGLVEHAQEPPREGPCAAGWCSRLDAALAALAKARGEITP